MTGAELIAAERQRQIDLGWSARHDDRYTGGELLRAGLCYCEAKGPQELQRGTWPFAATWWRPKDRLTNLVRGGALIAAERDRRERAGQRVAVSFLALIDDTAADIDAVLAQRAPEVAQ